VKTRFRSKLILVAIAVAGIVVIAWKGPSSPEGRYTADSNIGMLGDFYWELSNASWSLLVKRPDRTRADMPNQHVWVWIDDRGGTTNTFRIDSTGGGFGWWIKL
jgi:hypothetical protein